MIPRRVESLPLFEQERPRRRTHRNSKISYAQLDSATREGRIIDAIVAMGRATDRQVATRLGYADLNMVRPRVTDAIAAGLLRECGSVKCENTGRVVRLVEKVPSPQGASHGEEVRNENES